MRSGGSQGLECNAWGVHRAVRWNPVEGRKQEHSHRHSHALVVYKEGAPVLYIVRPMTYWLSSILRRDCLGCLWSTQLPLNDPVRWEVTIY